MKFRNALVAATIIAAPAVASADPISGLYIGAGAGYNYMQDLKVHGGGAVGNSKLTGDGGFIGLASLGYGLGNGLRLEFEGNYRQQHDRSRNRDSTRGGADIQTYGPMFNVLYDIDFGAPVIPYVGLGGGYEFTQLDNFNLTNTASNPTARFNGKNGATEGSPAAQAIVGAAFAIPGAPGLALTADYRFMDVFDHEKFKGTQNNGGVLTASKPKILDQYNHAVVIGVRYAFNAVSPPPPPAAVPTTPPSAVTRTYLVFFDWDRSDLTARARQIIAEAAQNATKVQTTRIEVSGHADRSGTPAYNQRLSLRRADTVAGELVRLGIARNTIAIMAYGDTRPLVPTAAGVREPQNRRVEIVLK